MPSTLDIQFDEMLDSLTGPGGRMVIAHDDQGCAVVSNFPATVPELLRTFCALYPDREAVVAGDERFSFTDLDTPLPRTDVLVGRWNFPEDFRP